MYTDLVLDKPRRLRFDLEAIKSLEAGMGGQPLGAIHHQLAQMGMTAVCVSLWAGLKHEDAALSTKLTTKILQQYLHAGGSVDVVIAAISRALMDSGLFHDADEAPEGNGQPEPTAT